MGARLENVPSVTRRQLLGSATVTVAAPLAGCADTGPADAGSDGTPDLLLRNCLQDAKDVEVTVTRVETGETVHEGTHSTPTDSCSDVGGPVEVDSVFERPGDYEIRATTSRLEPATATVTLTEAAVDDDSDTREILLDEDGITVA